MIFNYLRFLGKENFGQDLKQERLSGKSLVQLAEKETHGEGETINNEEMEI